MQSLPVQVRLCAPSGQLALGGGRHWLLATPSSVFVVTDLDLATQPGSAGTAASAGQRVVRVLSWQADNRSLSIGPGAASYVEIHENFNAGWTATLNGRTLTAVRLDGWQQAFIVPAGRGGVISLSYAPATVYHAGLIVVGAGACAVGGAGDRVGRSMSGADLGAWLGCGQGAGPRGGPSGGAAGPPMSITLSADRRRPRGGASRISRWPGRWPSSSRSRPSSGWRAARWWLAVPVLAGLGWWRPRWLPPVALGSMLIAGIAAATAGNPTAMGSGAFGWLAQACALVALAAALMPAIARPQPSPRPMTRPAARRARSEPPPAVRDRDRDRDRARPAAAFAVRAHRRALLLLRHSGRAQQRAVRGAATGSH